MRKSEKLILILSLCIIFSTFAMASDGDNISLGGIESQIPDWNAVLPQTENNVIKEEKGSENSEDKSHTQASDGKTEEVKLPGVEGQKPDFGTTPTTPPATSRTESSVREVVGRTTQIINIDGLDVPLADGSMFYIPFVDIAADAYYTAAVAWAYANDITAGVTELSFCPNATCTRGQMVTFLWRAAGCPEPTGTASAFSDVVAGSYYEKAVAWAVENGITTGMGDGKFDPNGIVNRAQTVTFLYRAKGKPAVASAAQFTDVAAGEYYADAVAWAVANEITNGMGDGSFAPANNCVRGQTVTFLYRAYK